MDTFILNHNQRKKPTFVINGYDRKEDFVSFENHRIRLIIIAGGGGTKANKVSKTSVDEASEASCYQLGDPAMLRPRFDSGNRKIVLTVNDFHSTQPFCYPLAK